MLAKLHIKWERWKYNKTFEVYVSNMGNVRNKSKASLAPKVDNSGYMRVSVGGSNPNFMLVHRLVMLTWRPTPEAEILTVDHKNHNKRDNSLENLEWVTYEENQRRAKNDLLTRQEIYDSVAKRCCVECRDKNNTVVTISNPTELSKAASQLKPEYGFNYDKFCNYVNDIWAGLSQHKAYCGIKIKPIGKEKKNA